MGLSDVDTAYEQAIIEYDKKKQMGEDCNFDEIHNRIRVLYKLAPLESNEPNSEEPIDPINDKQHYFWVKLHHDFFDTLIIKKLRIKEGSVTTNG